jgi:hypothetical protein
VGRRRWEEVTDAPPCSLLAGQKVKRRRHGGGGRRRKDADGGAMLEEMGRGPTGQWEGDGVEVGMDGEPVGIAK